MDDELKRQAFEAFKNQRIVNKPAIGHWTMHAVCACCDKACQVQYHGEQDKQIPFYICPECKDMVLKIKAIEANWKLK